MNNNILNHLFSKDGAFWFLYYLINATPFKKCVPDKWYLTIQYRCFCGKFINWKNPKTFNEKLQWLKVYNRKPEYTMMVDKVKVKDYVAQKIGEQYVIPTLGVWDKPEDIDFDALPNQFVLKCNHDSGSICICRDKKTFDKSKAVSKLKAAMKRDMYWDGREWPYKNVEKKVFAEKYMVDESGIELKDYKFFCFGGVPTYCQVISDRNTDEKIDFFDMQWGRLVGLVGLNDSVQNSEQDIPCPDSFSEMKLLAAKLANKLPFSRIDFYEINHRPYFGEITFFPADALGSFRPVDWNDRMGDMITLNV